MAINNEIGQIKTVIDYKNSGEIFRETRVIHDEKGAKVIIPKGFKIARDSAIEVDKGVVITDGTNEFVWIPVDDTSLAEMYNKIELEGATNIELSKSSLGETITTTKLYSKLRLRPGDPYTTGIPGKLVQENRIF